MKTFQHLQEPTDRYPNMDKWAYKAEEITYDTNLPWPKISVITPNYNGGAFIEDTMLSILNQQYPNLEYIVIDGGSTDNSLEIIKKYESQLTSWVSEKDNGQSDAINKGLRKGTGEIICWLNSDDVYLPGTLKRVGELFMQNPELDLVYGDILDLYDDQSRVIYHVAEFEPTDFLSRVSVHQPAIFWRNKIHEGIGYLDESLHFLMDFDFWLRIFFTYNTLKVNEVLTLFRRHAMAKTRNMHPGMFKDFRLIMSRFIQSVPAFTPHLPRLQKLGLLIEDPVRYSINFTFTEEQINTIINNYIYNSAVEEYAQGHTATAHRMFSEVLNAQNAGSVVPFLIKNLLMVPRLKSMFV